MAKGLKLKVKTFEEITEETLLRTQLFLFFFSDLGGHARLAKLIKNGPF